MLRGFNSMFLSARNGTTFSGPNLRTFFRYLSDPPVGFKSVQIRHVLSPVDLRCASYLIGRSAGQRGSVTIVSPLDRRAENVLEQQPALDSDCEQGSADPDPALKTL